MNKTKMAITATILTFGVTPGFAGGNLEDYRTDWEFQYVLLLINLIVTIGLFSIIVGRKLLKEGIYTNLKQAFKFSFATYILSTLLLLIISYFISGFDLLLLPLCYLHFVKTLLFLLSIPLSVVLNYIILRRFNLDNNNFKINKIIGTLLRVEISLFLVTCLFAIFYI